MGGGVKLIILADKFRFDTAEKLLIKSNILQEEITVYTNHKYTWISNVEV